MIRQQIAKTGTGSVAVTFGGATLSGSEICIAVIGPTSYATLSGFTAIQEPNDGGTFFMTLLYGVSTGQTTFTVTSAGASQAIGVEVYNSTGFDVSGVSTNGTTASTTIVSGSITTTNVNDIVLMFEAASATTLTPTAYGSMTTLSVSNTKLIGAYYIPGAILTGFTNTITSNSKITSSIIIAFKAPTAWTANMSGYLNTYGSVNKQAQLPQSATYSTSGSLIKSTVQFLTGLFSASGILTWIHNSSGTLHTQALNAVYSTSGALTKATNRTLSASYSASGSLNRLVSRTLSATFSTAGSLIKSIARPLTATYSASGNIIKSVAKTFTATYKTSGVLTYIHQHLLTLTATFKTSGLITSRVIGRTFTATYSTSGSLKRLIKRNLTATYKTSGNFAKQVNKTFTATFSVAGAISTLIGRLKQIITDPITVSQQDQAINLDANATLISMDENDTTINLDSDSTEIDLNNDDDSINM